ncbi:MAG: tRNA lysidine(34) synthetase TilS [Verrucomicrobiota bacterium]|nr:tRNA lysidine(34) synthetase TilS [Verrucomicrobiota bacterium]
MAKGAAAGDAWSTALLEQFPPRQRYLVGVSGGRDSVVLVHWLHAHGYRRLIVCHLDHRLRGRSSAADARFVARLAAANGFSLESSSAEVRRLAAETKRSIETAAREARFAFFAKVARRRRCHTIFLGHHADDLVETSLLNLFRGGGTLGLRGILPVAKREIGGVELTILRPLLGVSRAEIDDYIAAHRLRFREDASNQQLDGLRNRMRHRIIPQLEKEFGRDIRKAVRRAAAIAAEEDEFLASLVPPAGAELSLKALRSLPIALQRRAIVGWLRTHAVSEVSFDLVESVRGLLAPSGPAKVNLPGVRFARRRAGILFIG